MGSASRSRRPERSDTKSKLLAILVAAALAASATPAHAGRPLLDRHQLDGVFALFARDVMVPWKKPVLRLDTYSGAPVDFAAFEVDPAEVLVAGSARIRAIDTSARKPVVRWKFAPPAGYKFEANDVEIPLRNREGFFVIEARRGDASQQTWINLTRIGLVTKEAPEGWMLYAADLSNGQPLRAMRVTLLSGSRFVPAHTDEVGILRGAPGARFALAQWGRSYAFVSLSAQAPLPQALVGVRTDRGVVRAGEALRVVGFARRRTGQAMRPMGGEVQVSALVGGRSVAATTLTLAAGGGFSGELAIPSQTPAGDLTVLASAGGATGGSTVHVDAAGDLTVQIAAACAGPCTASAAVPLRVTVRSAGTPAANQPLTVRVVRTPHVIPPGEPESAQRWGTTTVAEQTLRTGADGIATFTLPPPTDGLASTYGVVASTTSATATTRVVVPNGATVLTITSGELTFDVGAPATLDVRGFDPNDGRPAAGRTVIVRLTKGPNEQEERVVLDGEGRGSVVFRTPQLGTNIATAQFNDDSSALDATAVTVIPQALGARATARSAEVAISLDKDRYKLGGRAGVTASLPGAAGSALLTLEGARVSEARVVGVAGGRAAAGLAVSNLAGSVRAGAVFVKDGAMYASDLPLAIDGPGYPRVTVLAADRSAYAPGSTAHLSISDGGDAAASMMAIRVSDGRPSGGASFDDAPAILAAGGTTTQNPASSDPGWHAYVAPAGSKAHDIFGTDRPLGVVQNDNSLAVSAPRALVWKIDRIDRPTFDLALPAERGRYVVSILKISDDGDVGAASLALSVL